MVQGEKKGSRLGLLAAAALLALIVLSAYWPAANAPFYFDDADNIVEAEALHWEQVSIANLSSLGQAKLPGRPVANLTFALNHVVSGLEVNGYRWVNWVIHLLVGIAIFLMVKVYLETWVRSGKLGGFDQLIILLMVGVFLLHPVNIQAVTYIVQRMASLAALFSILAFWAYMRWRHAGTAGTRIKYWVLFLVTFLLAMGSKENAAAILLVIAAYEAMFFGQAWHTRIRWLIQRPIVLAVGFASMMLVGYLLWMHYGLSSILHYWTEPFPGRDFSAYERVLTQFRIQFFYLSLLLWPHPGRLNLEHHFSVSSGLFDPISTLLSIIAMVAVTFLLLKMAKKNRVIAFPLVAYFLLHLVESGPIGLELVFEHRLYLPAAMLVLGGVVGLEKLSTSKPIQALALGLVLMLLWWATYERNKVWADTFDFHRDIISKSPQKYRPLYNYGTLLGQNGNYAEAEAVLQRSLAVIPKTLNASLERSKSLNQLGNVYLLTGRDQEAGRLYEGAIANDAGNYAAHYNLGRWSDRRGQLQVAKASYQQFLQMAPANQLAARRWVERRLSELQAIAN